MDWVIQKTSISWTDYSSNPIKAVTVDGKKGWFCTKVSPGCQQCYSERLNIRFGNSLAYQEKNLPKISFFVSDAEKRAWFDLKEPSKIFIEDMGDLFHEAITDRMLDSVFEGFAKAPWHIYQILTKRPERMQEFVQSYGEIPEHIWLGTSCEMSLYKNRIRVLQNIAVKIRFISFEPLIAPIGNINLSGISWAIVGGESGPNHRSISPEWVRELRDQCKQQGVAFFFKQWGGARPGGEALLDGRSWREYPEGGSLSSFHSLKCMTLNPRKQVSTFHRMLG